MCAYVRIIAQRAHPIGPYVVESRSAYVRWPCAYGAIAYLYTIGQEKRIFKVDRTDYSRDRTIGPDIAIEDAFESIPRVRGS